MSTTSPVTVTVDDLADALAAADLEGIFKKLSFQEQAAWLVGYLQTGTGMVSFGEPGAVDHAQAPIWREHSSAPSWPGPCPCACNHGGFCGGCGHAGCGGRR